MKTHENGYRAEHRVRGCLVYSLNMKALETRALKIVAAMYDSTVKDLRAANWGLTDRSLVLGFNDTDMKMWMVNTEGVGWEVDSDGNIGVWVRPAGGWFSEVRVPIPEAVLRGLQTMEMVDLADHVRAFGDRLESNFSLWFDTFMAGSSSKKEVSA
jgi:hypothetical protein